MKKLSLPQLLILIDSYLKQDTQQYQPDYYENLRFLISLDLLDMNGVITTLGKTIVVSVHQKAVLTEERENIFHPYKA